MQILPDKPVVLLILCSFLQDSDEKLYENCKVLTLSLTVNRERRGRGGGDDIKYEVKQQTGRHNAVAKHLFTSCDIF